MKALAIILIHATFVSCGQPAETNGSLKNELEAKLGKKDAAHLQEIVDQFDTYLEINYSDYKDKFAEYLNELSISSIKVNWQVDPAVLEESGLFSQSDSILPDSVWFKRTIFYVKYPNDEFIEETVIPAGESDESSIDSTIAALKAQPRYLLTQQSNLYSAVNSLRQSDSLILNYINAKEASGNLAPKILADILALHLTEKNEYIAKSILVLEKHE